MKTYLITTAIAYLAGIFITSSAFGQYQDKKVHLGLKFGVNYSTFTKDVGPFDKNSPGYADGPFAYKQNMGLISANVGVTADFKLNDKLTLATELILNGHGMEYDMRRDDIVLTDTAGNQTSGYDKYFYEIYYLELPILFRHNLATEGNTQFAVYAGISPGIKIAANSTYQYYVTDKDGNVDTRAETENTGNLRNFQLSTVAGLWYAEKEPSLNLPFTFFADLRFEYSHLPVFTNSQQNGSNYQTNMFNINFGFGIRF